MADRSHSASLELNLLFPQADKCEPGGVCRREGRREGGRERERERKRRGESREREKRERKRRGERREREKKEEGREGEGESGLRIVDVRSAGACQRGDGTMARALWVTQRLWMGLRHLQLEPLPSSGHRRRNSSSTDGTLP